MVTWYQVYDDVMITWYHGNMMVTWYMMITWYQVYDDISVSVSMSQGVEG